MILDMTFDWGTNKTIARGSDNWATTWGDDDHIYSTWGDGGGFGGTNSRGRVSLGVGRIDGTFASPRAFNLWGGYRPRRKANFGGKSYGILSVGKTLYMWVSPGSDTNNYREARISRSTDHGLSWSRASWAFTQAEGVMLPTFAQFGPGYQGARDGYVYSYFINYRTNTGRLSIQRPGEIVLARAPIAQVMQRGAWSFFAGPGRWTRNVGARVPVFRDPAGVGWNCAVVYNPALRRYLLTTEHSASFAGKLGVFDAPEPWGPWTTVHYSSGFGPIEHSTFYWNFPAKWLGSGGKTFVLAYTGTRKNVLMGAVRGRFVLSGQAGGRR